MRLPDTSLKSSIRHSTDFRTACQRRLGLYMYVSALTNTLNERERRGANITQQHRLGDDAIDSTNSTHRYNLGLQAVYTAERKATAAADTIRLGDKGNGTPASHAEAKQCHAHINNSHIPDMYRLGSPHDVYEFKCYTPFRGTRGALGNGSQRCGGAAPTSGILSNGFESE